MTSASRPFDKGDIDLRNNLTNALIAEAAAALLEVCSDAAPEHGKKIEDDTKIAIKMLRRVAKNFRNYESTGFRAGDTVDVEDS